MDGATGMDRLLGDWVAAGEMTIEGKVLGITGHTSVERLGTFVVMRTRVHPAEFPDSLSIIEGGEEGQGAPMHYFDERGVQRRYRSTVTGDRWLMELDDEAWRESPGFRQRYVGELSADGERIDGAWQRALDDDGERWEVDFTLSYTRAP